MQRYFIFSKNEYSHNQSKLIYLFDKLLNVNKATNKNMQLKLKKKAKILKNLIKQLII
jgi:hypothetical protein